VTAVIPDLLLRVVRGRVPSLAFERGQWRGDCPWCADAYKDAAPALYVYSDHYHCFMCGQHGDAISFLMWDEGIGFMAAVEWLAREHGLWK
jgi:DNA primase